MEISETKATCDSCLMSKSPQPVKKRYRVDLKCCTFYPFLPNYAIGAILSDTSLKYKTAQETLKSLIQKRRYALPIGMVAPVRYQLDFKSRKKDFGREEDWLCPYYDRGLQQCSMWAYRGAVCTSFYCRSSYGAKGKKFWSLISDYLSYVEMALLEEALIRLDFSPRQIGENLNFINREDGTFLEKKSWALSMPVAKKLWRDYLPKQEDFYIRCFEIVRQFDRTGFEEMLGELGLSLEGRVRGQWKRIQS